MSMARGVKPGPWGNLLRAGTLHRPFHGFNRQTDCCSRHCERNTPCGTTIKAQPECIHSGLCAHMGQSTWRFLKQFLAQLSHLQGQQGAAQRPSSPGERGQEGWEREAGRAAAADAHAERNLSPKVQGRAGSQKQRRGQHNPKPPKPPSCPSTHETTWPHGMHTAGRRRGSQRNDGVSSKPFAHTKLHSCCAPTQPHPTPCAQAQATAQPQVGSASADSS